VNRRFASFAVVACAWLATFGIACSHVPSPLAPNVSGSIGPPNHGVLLHATELPQSGPGFSWFRQEGHHFGLERLVRAIEAVAGEIDRARPGGSPLLIGVLSAREGGRLPGHASHRTGRDVDLLFYALTLEGEPIASPGFTKFGPDGISRLADEREGIKYARFDVAREWLLVKALLSSEDANIQWLFISEPLEALLIEYAIATGEKAETVWRAETVLLQPSDSLAHDDHIHARTACLPDEAVAGCEGGGPYWPWLRKLPSGFPPETDDSLIAALLGPFDTRAPDDDPR
jgi:penicillin-insensitive murein DD-endopeptidase